MLHEYAIEPEVLADWDRCRIVLDLMGFRHGRAVAAYPSKKRWKRMVLEACRTAGCGDVAFKRIHEKIRQIDAKLIWANRPYDEALLPDTERWVRNAVARQELADRFHAILA